MFLCYRGKKELPMSEHQILGILIVLQGILAVTGILLTIQVYREARDSAQKSRETEMLVSASLDVAREILRQVKR
jgi:hypothetical protein